MLEEKNVKFHMNDRVTEIRGENGKVSLPAIIFMTDGLVNDCRTGIHVTCSISNKDQTSTLMVSLVK